MERDSGNNYKAMITSLLKSTTDYPDCLELVFLFPNSSNREPGSFLFLSDLLELVERAGCSARKEECSRKPMGET
jgi:hypothetical protein